MINRGSLESSLPLAERLDQNRIFLTALDGSPLAALVNATRSGAQFNVETRPGEFLPDIENIAYIANVRSDSNGPSPHDVVMDEVTEIGVAAVQRIMTHARTVVRPVISELTEKVTQAINSLSTSSLLGMEVIVKNNPAVFENSSLKSAVNRFAETPFDTPDMRLRCPDQTVEDIIKLMASGSGGLDGDIKEWAGALGDSWFIWLWENAFQQKQAELTDVRPVSFRSLVDDSVHGANNALAIFLITRRLVEQDPIEGTEMALGDYERLIVSFRDQAALRLNRVLKDIDDELSNDVLVLNINGSKTTVNGPVYRKWIEAGGENEVLFGNMIDGSPSRHANMITERASALKQKWLQHESVTTAVESNRRFQRTKESLIVQFIFQLDSLSDDEKANLNVVAAQKLFREGLETLTLKDVDGVKALYLTCLKLVCRSRFYYTDAERILSTLDSVANDNPQLEVREAGLVAMIQYVSYWLSTQIKANPM